jgi:hypothetical protein
VLLCSSSPALAVTTADPDLDAVYLQDEVRRKDESVSDAEEGALVEASQQTTRAAASVDSRSAKSAYRSDLTTHHL